MGGQLNTSGIQVVGVVGYKRSGKDTFCSVLRDAFPKVVRLAIGDEIKRELAKLLGITVAVIEEFKEPYYRRPLQDLGSVRRRLDKHYWLRRCCDQIGEAIGCGARVVVSDVRLPMEAVQLRRQFGATIVRLHRKDQGPIDDHETERGVADIVADTEFMCGSPEEVQDKARSFGVSVLGWGEL